MSPPYLPMCGIYLPFQVNLHVPLSKSSRNNLFCMLEPLIWWQGTTGIFHARRVILDMCLFTIIHEKGVGNWNSQFHAQIEKIIETKLPPDWCWYGRYPRIRLAMECDWLVVGESKLYFSVWEPPIACVAWKMVKTLSHCVENESMPPKIIISVFKAWALAPLQINASLCEGPVYLCSCWVILLL